MAVGPNKLIELTKDSQLEWYKNEIPITREEKRHYKCANPDGPVNNSGCPAEDPYCNCPAKYLQPKDAFVLSTADDVNSLLESFSQFFQDSDEVTPEIIQQALLSLIQEIFGEGEENTFAVIDSNIEVLGRFEKYEEALEFIGEMDPTPEPTDEELKELLDESKLCEKIEEVLGEEYLGCEWDNPDGTDSCNCPNIGEKYHEWLEYTRTYCTFWNTPLKTPLLRNAQMTMATAQTCVISALGDLSIRPGAMIEINNVDLNSEELKSSAGKWMVGGINHLFTKRNHSMTFSLIRDSLNKSPDKVNT